MFDADAVFYITRWHNKEKEKRKMLKMSRYIICYVQIHNLFLPKGKAKTRRFFSHWVITFKGSGSNPTGIWFLQQGSILKPSICCISFSNGAQILQKIKDWKRNTQHVGLTVWLTVMIWARNKTLQYDLSCQQDIFFQDLLFPPAISSFSLLTDVQPSVPLHFKLQKAPFRSDINLALIAQWMPMFKDKQHT